MTDGALGGAWSELSVAGGRLTGPDWRVVKSPVAVNGKDVLYAEDPNGLRHLLVPYPEGTPEVSDTRSAGVQLTTRALEDSRGHHRFLDVVCLRRHLFEVFEHFANDVLDRFRKDENDVVRACTSVLSRWRELLEPEVGQRLSIQALAGLYGELLQLRELHSFGPTALATWRGPFGARHDFVVSGAAIEVKSTLAHDGWRLRIHGLSQLNADADEVLLLRAFRLELNGMGGESVPELIAGLIAAGIDRIEFLSLLSVAGYSPSDDSYYSRQRFRVIEHRGQLVTDRTPRIVPASFLRGQPPAGTEDIEYTIDLDASSEVPLSAEQIEETLKAFAGGNFDAARP